MFPSLLMLLPTILLNLFSQLIQLIIKAQLPPVLMRYALVAKLHNAKVSLGMLSTVAVAHIVLVSHGP